MLILTINLLDKIYWPKAYILTFSRNKNASYFIQKLFIRNKMETLELELPFLLIRRLILIVLHNLKDALNIPFFPR